MEMEYLQVPRSTSTMTSNSAIANHSG